MTSRERLLAVLDGRKPDRLPLSTYELCGRNSAAWENQAPSYRSLMDRIRCDTDAITMWNPTSNEVAALSAWPAVWQHETRPAANGRHQVTTSCLETPRGPLRRVTKTSPDLHTVWRVEHLCKDRHDVDRLLSIPYIPVDYDFSDEPRIRAELGPDSQHGILMPSIADPVCTAMELMSFEDAMIWALTERSHFSATVRQLHERCMANLERMLRGGVQELYRIVGSEYLAPPYMDPGLFYDVALPCLEDICTILARHGAKSRIHCHGRVGDLVDAFIASGCDALDPCEAPPDGDITLPELYRRTEGRLTLFGNIELRLLERGTPDEVRDTVRRLIDSMQGADNWVLMPTAAPIDAVLRPATARNYEIMIETARHYRA